jgi:hypothetical protein
MLSKGVCLFFQLHVFGHCGFMHICFRTLYRGYWRVVLEVGWLGFLVDR